VVDGRRFPRRMADIGIKEGRIAAIGKIESRSARSVLDASGLIVAPGAIDTHTHYDAQLFWDSSCSISSWHGVTSVVIGNCGFGFAPASDADQEYLMQSLTRVEAIPYAAIKESLPWTWKSFPDWLDVLARQPKAVNLLAAVPLNPLLINVMGLAQAKERHATPEERRRMCELLDEALAAGACGWSAQHTEPGSGGDVQRDFDGTPFASDLASDDTMLDLADVVSRYPNTFIQTTLSKVGGDKGNDETTAFMSEVNQTFLEKLAMTAQNPVIWNAIGTDSRKPAAHRGAIEWSRSCAQRGIQLFPQVNASGAATFFTMEDWNLFDDSPTWRDVTMGSPAERLAKLTDPSRRPGLREVQPTRGFQRITILRSYHPAFEHVSNTLLPDAARILGYDSLVDCFIDIVVADELKTKLQMPLLNEDQGLANELATVPYGLWGISDGGAHTKFLTLGSYPTECIINFTRDHELVTLEEAHWHLSGLPAYCAGLRDRGVIVEGAAADLVVYDHQKLTLLEEEIAEDLPGGEWRRTRRASGYRHILVNGEETFTDGVPTHREPGELLRRAS